MRATLVTMLTHQTSHVQIRRRQCHTNLLLRLAAGAGVRRLADIHFQFPAAGTPKAAIGFLGTFQQEDVVTLIEAVEQRGDTVR